MFIFIILSLIAGAAFSQDTKTVPSGVPLRVALEKRVRIQRVGEPIQGRLVEGIYVFDRLVLPEGTLLEGHIAEIGGVPAVRRVKALFSGNFTPPRDVRATFDTMILPDGSRVTLQTSLSPGTKYTARVVPKKKTPANNSMVRAFLEPGKGARLKSTLFNMLPYHRQTWTPGTMFNLELREPITTRAQQAVGLTGSPQSDAQEVTARLLHPITSRTAARGDRVEAVVTQPLFSNQKLLFPEGTRLVGDVVDAQRARHFHRNGKLLFTFRQIQLPGGQPQTIQGYLGSVDADWDAHLALNTEGAIHPSSPKTRFIFPALAVAAAGLSLHQDYDSQGIADQDIAGRAESGAVGLGVIGTVLAQTSRTVASSIAFSGAAYSVYTTFITRGQDVHLPAHTHVKVSVRIR